MKKNFYLFLISFLLLCITLMFPTFAAQDPSFDANFNNQAGAFYARGVPITITQNPDNEEESIIAWNDQTVTVPRTVTVFGGGSKGENYDSSSITMESGEVYSIVGGGISTEQGNNSTVQNASIVINNGTVTGNVAGGGYLYATVENASITIQNGNVGGIYGGGLASVTIDSSAQTVGTKDQADQSPNRVNKVDIVINNITACAPMMPGGYIYGGGQSYSYVGESNLTIHGGDFTKTTITAGSSDGYTESSNVEITGGTINTFQTINNGTLNSAKVTMTAGAVNKFYVGAETGKTSLTGTVTKAEINLLAGTIETLQAGRSNSQELEIDKQDHVVIKTQSFIVKNDNLKPDSITPVIYDVEIKPKDLIIRMGETEEITSTVTITPEEYENLFANQLLWESDNPTIAEVDEAGMVSGVEVGATKVRALLLDESEIAQVTVLNNNPPEINLAIFIVSLILLALIIVTILMFNLG